MKPKADLLTTLFVTGGGVGFVGFAPGTFGSLEGILLVWLLGPSLNWPPMLLGVVGVLFVIGVWVCSRYERMTEGHDPSEVVIDEIAAVPLAFLFVPFSPKTAILGFAFFRIFDILKPWPIKVLDRIQGGLGVMLDDLLAGFFAAVAVWATMRFLI